MVLRDLNPMDEVIKKPAISAAIAKELKGATNIEFITSELTKLHQEELISSDLLKWAIIETQREHEQMFAASNIDHDVLLKECPPIKLDNDDLYHASLCSTVVNTAHDTDQCKKLLQSLSYRSLKELSVSQSDDNTAFPKCMIAVSSDGSNATTCYVAFRNISDFKVWEVLSDIQKSTFGKGIYLYNNNIIINQYYTLVSLCLVLECQIEKFPTLYLEAIIGRKDRLVLTGIKTKY